MSSLQQFNNKRGNIIMKSCNSVTAAPNEFMLKILRAQRYVVLFVVNVRVLDGHDVVTL